tara:strand:- start:41157 stop:41753 length:597 start_codon:yes stop_codon:yes gene_type:complete
MKPNFSKNTDGLIPAIIQDAITKSVLMLGYMNQEALNITLETGNITFYSRSKKRLWTKGEESGNFLELINLKIDCDQDTILIQAHPKGPTCHRGTDSCWGEKNESHFGFLTELEKIISQRKSDNHNNSYISSLFRKGINKIAQKVGEEAVETVIEAKDENSELFLNESADLLFHYLILLNAKGFSLKDVEEILVYRKK